MADGHLVEKSKDFDLEKKTGDIVIHGHQVELNNKQGEELQNELKKLYDLHSTEGRAVKHEELKIQAAQIARWQLRSVA